MVLIKPADLSCYWEVRGRDKLPMFLSIRILLTNSKSEDPDQITSRGAV